MVEAKGSWWFGMQSKSPTTPRVELGEERAGPRGWVYGVVMHHADESVTRHEVSLAYVDHEYWCGGRLAPSAVVERVLLMMLDAGDGALMPATFDLARGRRWHAGLDADVRGVLRGSTAA